MAFMTKYADFLSQKESGSHHEEAQVKQPKKPRKSRRELAREFRAQQKAWRYSLVGSETEEDEFESKSEPSSSDDDVEISNDDAKGTNSELRRNECVDPEHTSAFGNGQCFLPTPNIKKKRKISDRKHFLKAFVPSPKSTVRGGIDSAPFSCATQAGMSELNSSTLDMLHRTALSSVKMCNKWRKSSRKCVIEQEARLKGLYSNFNSAMEAKSLASNECTRTDIEGSTSCQRWDTNYVPDFAPMSGPAQDDECLSPPKPSTTILIKSEPLSDYEYCDTNNYKKPRLEADPIMEVKKEDIMAIAIKEEFNPEVIIKEEIQSEDENVMDCEDDNTIDCGNIVSYELNRIESVVNYEIASMDGDGPYGTTLEISNEKLESIAVSSSQSLSGFSGFSFASCEQPQPYVVDSPVEMNKATKRVQTDVSSAFQHHQLMTYDQLTEDKLLIFTDVTKHKFMILYNFLFCNGTSFIVKCLSNEDQLLLVLFRFKHNPSKEYLSHLFGITEKQVSHIMSYITTKFRGGLNDVTMWSLKEGKCSLSAIMECREFISNSLKSYCPHQEIAQFF